MRLRFVALAAVLAVVGSACTLLDASRYYEITAEFDRTFNLFEGSRVRVLGVTVGQIEEIEFEPGMEGVRVRMNVRDDVTLPSDVTAAVVPEALLGERYVDLHPAYTGGPRLEAGTTIPLDRTRVPAEFDEILESLNDFLDGLPPEEVARLVDNLSDVLRDRGEELGTTLEDVATAIEVLRANDDAIVSLSRRLADLNETLSSRDVQIGDLIDDWGAVVDLLAQERDDLDAALSGVARLSTEVGGLLSDHREDLDSDIDTLTRFGRTAARNIDELDLLLEGQSELYRHAERVFDFERNWLPLVNHSEDVMRIVANRLQARLARVCDELDLGECADPSFWEGGLPDEICLTPVATCPEDMARMRGEDPADLDIPADERPVPLADALEEAIELVPELPGRLADKHAEQEAQDRIQEEHRQQTQDAIDRDAARTEGLP